MEIVIPYGPEVGDEEEVRTDDERELTSEFIRFDEPLDLLGCVYEGLYVS